LFAAGLDDAALVLLWDESKTLRRMALRETRCAWYRESGLASQLAKLRSEARGGMELRLWPWNNRSLALSDEFDAEEAANAVLEQVCGRAATLGGQAPGQLARVVCPERRFAAFTEALLARLESTEPRTPLPELESDFESDLESAFQMALDEGASPIYGEPAGPFPLVLTNVDPRLRLVRERRPRPMLSLIRAANERAAVELARELDAAAFAAGPSPQAQFASTAPLAGAASETSIRTPPTDDRRSTRMITAAQVHETLKRHQLADGLPFVFDLERSHGSWLVDGRDGKEYLDMFTCFASWPIGYNHPRMAEAEFCRELSLAAANNPANSDLYTASMARFVEAFATRVTPAGYPHHFWIAGGALAVENALKVAFDWKARKLGRRSMEDQANDLVVLHLRGAFHGRSGYTLSLTNTDPNKIGLFPKFDWPRVHSPAIEFDLDGGIANDIAASEAITEREIEAAFAKHPGKIACILIEPLQGEGGDNHFRPEFLARLRRFADEGEALLVFDEVQTGFFGSGTPWLWQQKNVRPDVVAFGKKSQICGIYANARVDEVSDNAFARPGRINSTWGGNLVDMVRSRQIIDIILGEKLPANIAAQGERFVAGLRRIAKSRGAFSNVRGIGSLVAFTLESPQVRDEFIGKLRERNLLALKSGPQAIRFRMPLVISAKEVDWALDRIESLLPAAVR
jgi:L-lysine 6-transaminase